MPLSHRTNRICRQNGLDAHSDLMTRAYKRMQEAAQARSVNRLRRLAYLLSGSLECGECAKLAETLVDAETRLNASVDIRSLVGKDRAAFR